jgi:ankyrin repeat protein
LLGMSSDEPGEAGLQPDHKVPWNELFQKLVKFVLSNDVSVETKSQYGLTPLSWAAGNMYDAVVNLLLVSLVKYGVDPN